MGLDSLQTVRQDAGVAYGSPQVLVAILGCFEVRTDVPGLRKLDRPFFAHVAFGGELVVVFRPGKLESPLHFLVENVGALHRLQEKVFVAHEAVLRLFFFCDIQNYVIFSHIQIIP